MDGTFAVIVVIIGFVVAGAYVFVTKIGLLGERFLLPMLVEVLLWICFIHALIKVKAVEKERRKAATRT